MNRIWERNGQVKNIRLYLLFLSIKFEYFKDYRNGYIINTNLFRKETRNFLYHQKSFCRYAYCRVLRVFFFFWRADRFPTVVLDIRTTTKIGYSSLNHGVGEFYCTDKTRLARYHIPLSPSQPPTPRRSTLVELPSNLAKPETCPKNV